MPLVVHISFLLLTIAALDCGHCIYTHTHTHIYIICINTYVSTHTYGNNLSMEKVNFST